MTTSLEALLEAIKRKDAAAVTRALDAAPALATARSASGQTPAIVAIYWRAPQMLALLRARGADSTSSRRPPPATPSACARSSLPIRRCATPTRLMDGHRFTSRATFGRSA